MAKKMGLNQQEIIQYHKMLKQDIPLPAIARHFKTDETILKALAPAKIKDAAKEAEEAEAAAAAELAERQQAIAGAVEEALK